MTIDTWSEGDDGDVGFLCKDHSISVLDSSKRLEKLNYSSTKPPNTYFSANC